MRLAGARPAAAQSVHGKTLLVGQFVFNLCPRRGIIAQVDEHERWDRVPWRHLPLFARVMLFYGVHDNLLSPKRSISKVG